ncbi:protein HIGH CHLOROPHYLL FLUORESCENCE PHENOTYPE 173, chloroplastic [Impatiens glandulifera]|uniref:protein HIGH CHLOROPHYLL FLUORESCENCE PHENOTYPE 173, chloroplastic n=1 Tax=Impatiens glandulifera TaxID=253017 RepID=UPI001FB12CA9|nr:protein HIGH CHLOROPHYLL FLUORESCENCE PHENOTYPE 173, chloroplastic [Impatiens glandulifera]
MASQTTTAAIGRSCQPCVQTLISKPSPEFRLGLIPLRRHSTYAAFTSSSVGASNVHDHLVSALHRRRGRSGSDLSLASTLKSADSSTAETPKKGKKTRNSKRKKKIDDDDEVKEKEGEESVSEVVDNSNIAEIDNQQQTQQPMISLDDVNPVGLGRRSRQIFDEVWRKFSGLGQISRTNRSDDEVELLIREGGPMCEFAIPGAQNTTVLVVGATSRVGRIVVRKLMLRGYTVKALVRKDDEDVVNMLPTSVKLVIGDVGDPSSLNNAIEGCSKIIYCATARSSVTVDLNRVDNQGVYNVTKAFQDYNNKLAQLRAGKSSKSKLLLAKFQTAESLDGWEVREGTYFQDGMTAKYDGGMDAKFEFTEDGKAVFSGYVFTRGGYVELSKRLSLPLGYTLDRYEGLVLSVGGNGRSYVLILEAGPSGDITQSKMYFARFNTKVGFCRVRVPFSSFRSVQPDDPPLDPFLVHTMTIRFEPRRQRPIEGADGVNQDLRSFKLIMEYVKALPTGQETDFILVSCTGLGIEPSRREQVLRAKKSGEDSLRRSGIGYTIIRPGPLQEEPGGQRALIFDQGNRISQGISCADVADICVKALHDSTARNKSFDVCYEYVAEPGKELYELVAHLPDKANNYLTPALSVLEKNT